LSISDVLEQLNFEIRDVTNYTDLGTQEDFIAYRKKLKNYIVDIDGVLVENGSEFFSPKWENTKQIKENVEKINKLYDEGNYIILMTARKENYKEATKNVLKGVKYHQLIMGVLHGSRVTINDYSSFYPTAESINIKRNAILEEI
jgi:histidinol phosphatase-like enzyme